MHAESDKYWLRRTKLSGPWQSLPPIIIIIRIVIISLSLHISSLADHVCCLPDKGNTYCTQMHKLNRYFATFSLKFEMYLQVMAPFVSEREEYVDPVLDHSTYNVTRLNLLRTSELLWPIGSLDQNKHFSLKCGSHILYISFSVFYLICIFLWK